MGRKDGKFSFGKKDRKRIWKNLMEEIINEEHDWDHNAKSNTVEGIIENATRKEMVIAIKAIKPGKTAGPFAICAEMMSASGELGINVMMKKDFKESHFFVKCHSRRKTFFASDYSLKISY